MPLASGSGLGPYEIVAPLGAGGMGEVYRARDPRLGRDVAIKILSDLLADDPEHMARFEREARLLAAVDHPNIAVIHGFESDQDRRFLVMELIAGETLAERLAAGALSNVEALEIAIQIAGALAAAHDRGVIHRDLKPGNIRLTTDNRVKVLDFGLAKSVADSAAESAVATAAARTQPGSVLGTPAYMSPEQARGQEVDRRTDLWSFGCTVFEMLAGRRPFERATASDTLVAILGSEPDWNALPGSTPPPLTQTLRGCLEKDARRRIRDAADVRLALEAILAAEKGSPRGASPDPGPRTGLRGLLRPLAGLFGPKSPPAHATPEPRPQPALSQVTFSDAIEGFPSWSPAGDRIAFAREVGAVRNVFVKDLASESESQVTCGEFDDIQPDWSADGARILFARSREPRRKLEPGDVFGRYEGTDVWSLDLATGRESRLVENAANPCGSPEGSRIALDARWAGPHRIWTVDALGRNPDQVTTDASEGVVHVRPRWSPDGARLVFQNVDRTKFDVRVVDLRSKKMMWITNDQFQDVCPVWSASGSALYFSSYRSGGMNVWRARVTKDGALEGPLAQLTTGAGQDVAAAVSRDGKRLAFSILRQNANVWKLPVDPLSGRPAGDPRKVTASTREDSRASWSPDQSRIAFNSDRAGQMNIWLADLAGGPPRPLTRGPGGDFQPRFSPDGSSIVFFSSRSGTADIWLADVETAKLTRLTRGSSIDVNPFFSPDGARIAYMSDQGGRVEVWVMASGGSDRRPLTQTGVMGHFLAWTPRGDAIVFRTASATVLRVLAAGGDPAPLPAVAGGAHMSFSPDGSRILDVVAHKELWVSPLDGAAPEKVFEFEDPDVRIDYPVWSPDGRWVLFDRFRPQGGDIWLMEGFE